MDRSNTIAWLIPSAGNQWALEAARMTENKTRLVLGAESSGGLGLGLGDICQDALGVSLSDIEGSNLVGLKESKQQISSTQFALKLSFDKGPKGRHGFVIGTDPKLCDIVLPRLPGVSRQHCYISFDQQKRLVLKDFSRRGTSVWYDGSSNGDRRQESWLLGSGGSYGFPDTAKKIVIDIQTIRFQIIVWDPSSGLEAYKCRVNNFLLATTVNDDDIPDRETGVSLASPLRHPTFVKHSFLSNDGLSASTYLWNVSRPWEPMVKVAG